MSMVPFTSIVGQHRAKRSLLCQIVDPQIGGCLLIGPPGCGKTTLARAAAHLLPRGSFVNLPLGCSEERLLGGIDPITAVEGNKLHWREGLLAQADEGVCYVDEVNLLPDQITDHLLDVAASGRLLVERDGHSINQNCSFVLVGSMNPEEGNLRPQLADRFAHQIELDGVPTREERRQLLQWHLDDDRENFKGQLSLDLQHARERLEKVETSSTILDDISYRCDQLKLSGHRRELAVWRTARALTALDGLTAITNPILDEAWQLCSRRDDPDEPESSGPPDPSQGNAPSLAPKQESTSNQNKAISNKGPAVEPQHPSGAQSTIEMARPTQTSPIAIPRPCMESPKLDLVRSLLEHSLANLQNKPPKLYWQPTPTPEFWHLIDASRSTARQGSLSFAKERAEKILRQSCWPRQHIAILHNGEVNTFRRVNSKAANMISNGAGSSPLALVLEQLSRQLRRRQGSGQRSLEIHSDGLLTPEKGESLAQARERCRAALFRLGRAAKVSWHLPRMHPRFISWTEDLLSGLPVTLYRPI